MVAGVCAAVVSWLVNALGHPRWLTARNAMLLVAGVTVLAAMVATVQEDSVPQESATSRQPSSDDRRQAEEKLIGRLDPGAPYARVKQLLGNQEPDRKMAVRTGFIAQFRREWEYVHVLVDKQGNTDAIGIISRDERFRPDALALWPSPFGKTIAEFEKELDTPITGLMSFCGAHRGAYIEVVDTDRVPAAFEFRSTAFGNLSTGPMGCASWETSMECYPRDWDSGEFNLASCLQSTGWDGPAGRNFRRETAVWAVVVTAPDHHLTLDMLRLPEDIAG
jgi:hypothetical protein